MDRSHVWKDRSDNFISKLGSSAKYRVRVRVRTLCLAYVHYACIVRTCVCKRTHAYASAYGVCKCVLYIRMCVSTCLRTVSSYVQVWRWKIKDTFPCSFNSLVPFYSILCHFFLTRRENFTPILWGPGASRFFSYPPPSNRLVFQNGIYRCNKLHKWGYPYEMDLGNTENVLSKCH